jgi:hypothetical protein
MASGELRWGGRFRRGDGGAARGECAGALCAPVEERKRRGRGRGAGTGGAAQPWWRWGAGGRGRPRQVGPTCRRVRERGRREVGRQVRLGREGRMGRGEEKEGEWAGWGRGLVLFFVFFKSFYTTFQNLFESNPFTPFSQLFFINYFKNF